MKIKETNQWLTSVRKCMVQTHCNIESICLLLQKRQNVVSGDVIYASALYYNMYRNQSKSFNSLYNISIYRPVVDVSVDFSSMKRYQTTGLFCFVFLHYTRYQEDFPPCKTIKRDAMTTALLDGSLKTVTKNRQEQKQK